VQASESLHTERSAEGFSSLGILIENTTGDPPTAANVKTWMTAYSVTFPVLADPEKAVFNLYVPSPVLPTSLVIDRAGIIRMRLQGTTDDAATEAKLRAAIDEALKTGGAATGG
jgi:hypothetical protein